MLAGMKLTAKEQARLDQLRDTTFPGQVDLYEQLGEPAPEPIEAAGEEIMDTPVHDAPNTVQLLELEL